MEILCTLFEFELEKLHRYVGAREGEGATASIIVIVNATFGSIWCSSREASNGELSEGIPLRFQDADG